MKKLLLLGSLWCCGVVQALVPVHDDIQPLRLHVHGESLQVPVAVSTQTDFKGVAQAPSASNNGAGEDGWKGYHVPPSSHACAQAAPISRKSTSVVTVIVAKLSMLLGS